MKKKVVSVLLAAAMAMTLFAGCGGGNDGGGNAGGAAGGAGGAEASDNGGAGDAGAGDSGNAGDVTIDMDEDPYEVGIQVVVLPGVEYDESALEAAINEITVPAINAKVDVQITWISELVNTTSMGAAGGDKLDILAVSTVSPLSSMVGSDILLDLNENNLLQTRGKTLCTLFADIMEVGYANGQQLAIPAKTFNASSRGVYYNKDLADAAGLDIPASGTWDDWKEILRQFHAANPDVMPWYQGNGETMYLYWLNGYEGIGTLQAYGAVMDSSKSTTVENFYATDLFKNYCLDMYNFRQEGILTKDSTDTETAQNYYDAGQLFSVPTTWNEEQKASYAQRASSAMGFFEMVPPQITNSAVTEYMWGISSSCERPDKAMDVLNFLYENADFANLMKYGLEGSDYNLADDGHVEATGSYLTTFYFGGDQTKMLCQAPDPGSYITNFEAMENSASISPIISYMFNDANFQTESAVINTTILKYLPTLQTGMCASEQATLDYIDQLNAELSQVGMDDVIAANQEQLNSYLETR